MSKKGDSEGGRLGERIVVTGLGHISAAGLGIDRAWQQMETSPPKPTQVQLPVPFSQNPITAYQTPDYSLADLGLARNTLTSLPKPSELSPDLKSLVGATALALTDADLGFSLEDRDPPVAVVAANESPGFGELAQKLASTSSASLATDPRERYSEFAPEFFQLNTFLLPHYLARIFGLRGTSLFVNSACTSGLSALEIAAQEIRSGRSTLALVAAADDPLSFAKHAWFSDLGLYARDGVIRPFDQDQTGTIFGAGAGCFVLESRRQALDRGARIYCEYLGAYFGQDGWKLTVPSPLRRTTSTAITRLLQSFGLRPEDLDIIMPHGVGTPASDQYEAAELTSLFKGTLASTLFTAMKPMFGHNLGGSALLEATILASALFRGVVPPTLNHTAPLRRHPLPMSTSWETGRFSYGLKMSCGFAGYHGAALFRRTEDGS